MALPCRRSVKNFRGRQFAGLSRYASIASSPKSQVKIVALIVNHDEVSDFPFIKCGLRPLKKPHYG
jgi:hypothetical protein